MALLFFISGMASFYSFKNRSGGDYIWERTRKLIFPFLLGWFLFLCPVAGYIKALYEGYGDGFLNFLPQFFWYQGSRYLGYGHLWFLLYLYVFSLLCVPLFNLWKKDEDRLERIGSFFLEGHRLLLPAGFIIALELCLRPFFHTDAYIIVSDWANDAVYLSLFIFGYVFASDERIQEKITGYYKPSIVFGLLSLGTLFYVNVRSQMLYSNEAYLTPLWVISKGIYECSAIIFLLNFGRKFLNRDGRAIRYLSKASFTYYIFHYLPVTFFTWLFHDSPMHIFLKFLLVVILSYVTILCIYGIWSKVRFWAGKNKELNVKS